MKRLFGHWCHNHLDVGRTWFLFFGSILSIHRYVWTKLSKHLNYLVTYKSTCSDIYTILLPIYYPFLVGSCWLHPNLDPYPTISAGGTCPWHHRQGAAGSFMMDTLNFGWTYSYYIRTIILYLYYGKCRKIKDIIIFRGTADPFFSYDTSQLYSHQMIPVGLISKSHLAIPPWSPKPLVGNPSIGGTVRCWLNFDDEDHF